MKRLIFIVLTLVLIAFTFFTGFFIKKDSFVSTFSFFDEYLKIDLFKENLSLKIENENLKAQLQKAQFFNFSNLTGNSDKNIAARIFSTYPFNTKNILTIDKGLNDGVAAGMAAIVESNIFVGEVYSAEKKSSSIRTVFDPSWQLPVKIGENKINGLFKGGNDPKITLIEKPIKEGDGVFLASNNFPLYLKIGNISKVTEESGNVFKEAFVQMPYSINELENVYLVK